MKTLMEEFLATVLPRPTDTRAFDCYPPNIFCAPKFYCAQKNLFQIYDKNKNLCPLKMYVAPHKPENLATGLVLPKLCLQLIYFVLKAIRPRDVA